MIERSTNDNLPALPGRTNGHGNGSAPAFANESAESIMPAWLVPEPVGPPAEHGRALPVPVQQGHALPAAAPPPPLFPDPPSSTDARWEFYDRLDMLRRGWRWIVGIMLAALGIMAAATFTTTPAYDAYAVLLINEKHPVLEAATEYASVPGLEERRLLNQALILRQSPEIAERTANRLLAENRPLAITERFGPDVTVERLARHLQSAVVRVEEEGKDVDAVRITARSPSAEEAALIASIYTEEYVARTRETSRMALTNARAFLESQLADRQEQLAGIERSIERFETGTGTVDLSQQAASRIRQVAELETALDRARVEQQLRGAALRSVESELAELQPRLFERIASGSEQELRQLNERIAGLELTIESIYQRNPEVRQQSATGTRLDDLRRQLDDLKSQRTELTRRYVDEVVAAGGVDITDTHRGGQYLTELRRRMGEERVALAGSEAEIQAIEQRIEEARGALAGVPSRTMQLAQLRRSQATTENMVLYLTERAEQARIAEETEFGLAQIIRPARAPSKPASPRTGLNLSIGLVLGLLLGVGVAAARHKLDGALHAPRDLHAHGLEVLGVLPSFSRGGRCTPVVDDPESSAAEAYRHLLANMRLGRGGPRPQALVVAAAERDAGATTTALNLAMAAAGSGLRTLIVDGDLRNPGLKGRLKLTERISRGGEAAPVAYWATSVKNLVALTPTSALRRKDGLWSRERVRELLMRVRPAFDLIIFDAPPALLSADASMIASQADAVLLVARARHTHRDALAQAATELHGVGGELLGAVLNAFDARMAFGYRHTFGYRHQQPTSPHA